VIKKRLRKVSAEAVRDAILGFTIANDVSAENIEGRDHHLLRSKGADSFCPMGPWIDTEYDPVDRLVEAFHNGTLIRSGRTSERIWDDVKILSWLSSWITLEAGDVVLTGTPPRLTPRRYLRDGDTFSARVEGLGQLTNTFRHVAAVGLNA
jgi:2-keto-4-pentenoate hydratase/2-oxohepta-3-ene-1,7-dioic acid hydratase in catechol pathway